MSVPAPALTVVQVDRLRLTADGKIVDFLDEHTSRPDKPEERVRQNYGRTLHLDYAYPKNLMVFEAPISIGSETKFVDIAVYQDAQAARVRDQAKLRLVVETKAPDEKRGLKQLQSYIFASSAEGGVWINSTDAPQYLRRVNTRLDQWPNVPRSGEDWDAIGKHKKRHLHTPHNLVETFKRCHNALYKVGIDSEDLAMDMVRMILAKYRDESDEGDTCEFRCTALELQSQEGRKRVADRVRTLFDEVRADNLDVFDEHEAISAGDREIATVVSELQDFRFIPDEESGEIYDVVGAAYEVYVGSHLKGDRGQFFTNRLIVGLLVRLVNPTEHDVILDPAMGSGGFLIAAMRHVTKRIMQGDRTVRAKRDTIGKFQRRIFGIDKSPKLVKVARTNMILASDGHSGLVHGDTLNPPGKLPDEFRRKAGPGIPTIILTNPPFGATSEHKITADKEPEILAQFDIGHIWKADDNGDLQPTEALTNEGAPPEYLFVERCIRWVRPGGRIGIVVPRGLLDNDKALIVRTLILRETKVLAVLNCHDFTFKPNTNAKASLLVLERKKTQASSEDDYSVFMAISQAIGHNEQGVVVYKTDAKGDLILRNGEPVVDHDMDEILRAWEAINEGKRSASEWYFKIKRKDILATPALILNPVRYLPRYNKSRQKVMALDETEEWTVKRLGDPSVAEVFNGPRLKRPYADKGVTRGPTIVRYLTGLAVTQSRGENIKYLDLAKAKPVQARMIEKLYLRRGMILITDAGTVGRVIYATAYHDGAIGTNNLIRVVVKDEALRGYVYQFLSSRLGQDQLRRNVYGGIIDHLEPDEVANVLVPIPKDRAVLETIGNATIKSMRLQDYAFAEAEASRIGLAEELEEDAHDAEVARARLAEIEDDPSLLIRGEELDRRLAELLG